jgi:molecular chaperone GrpE (heat shock protein)
VWSGATKAIDARLEQIRLEIGRVLDNIKRVEEAAWRRQEGAAVVRLSQSVAEGVFESTLLPVLKDMIVVHDRAERIAADVRTGSIASLGSLQAAADTVASLAEEMESLLERHGLTPIRPKVREDAVDALLHEVVGRETTSDVALHGRVAALVRGGYRLGRAVIRPAQVRRFGPSEEKGGRSGGVR